MAISKRQATSERVEFGIGGGVRGEKDARGQRENETPQIDLMELRGVREKVGREKQEALGFEGAADAGDGRRKLLFDERVRLGAGNGCV